MSQFEDDSDNDVNEYGLFDYKYLDYYWTEGGRFPFFIMESGKLTGFVLVRKIADGESPKFSVSLTGSKPIVRIYLMILLSLRDTIA